MELYKTCRPKTLSAMVGQKDAIATVMSMMEDKKGFPHALMLTGPSGCGKTTVARILKTILKCGDGDYDEKNAADFRGIDTIREIRSRMGLAPLSGQSRIYHIDEAHQLTKDAQNALLKMLEDTPDHVYFILSSTDANKIIKTIHTRCTEIKLAALRPKELEELVKKTVKNFKEKIPCPPTEEVVDRIVEAADGSARKAMVVLGQVLMLKTEDAQIDAIQKADSRAYAFELFKLLIRARKEDWPAIGKMLSTTEDEPEMIRRIVLACANTALCKSANARAASIINSFRDPLFDDGKASRAVLTLMCYEVVFG